MAETAHTPGPWFAGASTFYPGLDGPMTMRVYTDHPPTEFEVTGDNITANARLIAAAPDLLEALVAMRDHGGEDWVIDKALAAIARATGEKEPDA